VDAADLHLLLKPALQYSENFSSGSKAEIDNNKCTQCGLCKDVCRFNAIHRLNESYLIDDIDCEGCGYCYHVCPESAIKLNPNSTGKIFTGQTRIDNKMIHAKLNIGADNSGKLVSKIREEAKLQSQKTNTKFIIVDGPPGIGCPVIASITGANYIVIVTEPTVSGLHDLQRVYELTSRFRLAVGCIINKADINPSINRLIKNFLKSHHIDLLSEIQYDSAFSKAITNGQTIIETENGELSKQIHKSWLKILKN
jgi:MinD superfamily P-loop ATPase